MPATYVWLGACAVKSCANTFGADFVSGLIQVMALKRFFIFAICLLCASTGLPVVGYSDDL